MEKSAAGKRFRDSNETSESIAKKIKSEPDDDPNEEPDNDSDEDPNDDPDDDPNRDNGNQQQRDITREEESHFLNLFTNILNTVINLKNLSNEDISENLRLMIQSFLPRQTFHETDFTRWENICAYLYRYASHGAGLARFRILNAIRNCEILERVLKRPDLRIVSLGSGPGNDAVGLCSSLSELQFPKTLKMTLVDKFKEWSLCIKLAEVFIEEENFGKVSELFQRCNVEMDFIKTDLTRNMKTEMLGEADVILMSKFFTSLDRKNDGLHERAVIKTLYKNTKNDVVIIVIDELVYVEDRWRDFRLLYKWGDGEENVYRSTALAQRRFNSHDIISSKLPIHIFVKKGAKVYY